MGTLFIVAIGIAFIVGGSKLAGSVIRIPLKVAGELLGDLIKGVLKFAFDLVGSGFRFGGGLLNRGARRGLRLPPPSRRHERSRKRCDDCERFHDDDHHH